MCTDRRAVKEEEEEVPGGGGVLVCAFLLGSSYSTGSSSIGSSVDLRTGNDITYTSIQCLKSLKFTYPSVFNTLKCLVFFVNG